MIHGYMATFGAYGSWMPNDPRGSKSQFVGSPKLYNLGGPVRKHQDRTYAQLAPADRKLLSQLEESLNRPPVQFSVQQISQMGQAFGWAAAVQRKTIWALAVMPLHVHVVFARSGRRSSEEFVDQLKDAAAAQLAAAGLLPAGCDLDDDHIWAAGQWIDFLDSEHAIDDAINYTIANPGECGLPSQKWSFVIPFSGIAPNIVSYSD